MNFQFLVFNFTTFILLRFSSSVFLPLQTLLIGVNNCEINILHDGVDSKILRFRNFLPSRIFKLVSRNHAWHDLIFKNIEFNKLPHPLPLPIIRTREFYCKIKILIGTDLLNRKGRRTTKLAEWMDKTQCLTVSTTMYIIKFRGNPWTPNMSHLSSLQTRI